MLTLMQIEQILKEHDKLHQEHTQHIQDLNKKVKEHNELLNKEITTEEVK